eukprot:GFKZ01013131.1.p1 GENE.GFKZ01013131.1~~GFKZ01013131.1.p1  ORF type:complete len:112 (+),score=9.40 GFKZ01013131.1:190-525(+)
MTAPQLQLFPNENFSADGIELLDAPFGTAQYMKNFLRRKLQECAKTRFDNKSSRDARIRFHLYFVCSSACMLQRVSTITWPTANTPLAEVFDRQQMEWNSKSNELLMTDDP